MAWRSFQVERRQRLIQEQHGRLHDQRPRERHALLLPARQLPDGAVHLLVEPHQRDSGCDPAVDLRRGQFPQLEAIGDVLPDVHVGEQAVALKHHVGRPFFRPQPGHVPPADFDTPAARIDEAADHPEQGGLAAAGGP
jgi:hypothetical protein